MNIRVAAEKDIPIIHKLAQEIWPVAYKDILSPAQLAYMLELIYSPWQLEKQMVQGQRFLIINEMVYESTLPVGFASFSKKSKADPVFHLNKLYVLPRQQGKGTGRSLLEYILNIVKNEGGSALQLNVNRNNIAQEFYHKMGFNIIREEDIDIGNGYFMNDYVMERKIVHSS